MTLASLHAALSRVTHHIATAPNSVALGELLAIRASLKDQINQHKGAR